MESILYSNHRLSLSSGDKKIHRTKSKRKKTDPNFDESPLFKVSVKVQDATNVDPTISFFCTSLHLQVQEHQAGGVLNQFVNPRFGSTNVPKRQNLTMKKPKIG